MNIIPVIDILRGQVVRGVAGKRESYRPVRSRIVVDSQPATVARAFAQHFGFEAVYVADLDAISGHEPNWAAYEEIAAAGLRPLLDAGIRDANGAAAWREVANQKPFLEGVIVGLESICDAGALADTLNMLGADLAIFSLDLMNGRPLTESTAWRGHSPLQIATRAAEIGFPRLIVLDLTSVGVGQGPATLELGRAISRAFPDCRLIGGGGVRGVADVRNYHAAGYHSVLVASALHDAKITPDDLIAS